MFQRAFSNIPIPTHILLLLLVFVLRLPSFDSDFFLPGESQALLIAKKLQADGGKLYQDAWYGRPPLLVWVYEAAYTVFGKYTLWVIRLLTCFYIYLTAVYFGGTIASFKPIHRMGWMPALLLVWMLCMPWYAQEMNHTLLVLLPLTVSFFSVLQLESRLRTENYAFMFQAGFWLMVSILASFKMVFMLAGVGLTYILLQPPKLDEIFSLIGGALIVVLGVSLFLYFNGNLAAFWDQGVMHYIDLIRQPDQLSFILDYQGTLLSLAWSWLGILVVAGFGFVHFRVRFFTYVAKIRLIERLMSFWLVFGVIAVLIKAPKFEIQDFILVIPPIAFYGAKMMDIPLLYRLRSLVLTLLVVPGLATYINYWVPLPQSLGEVLPAGIAGVTLTRTPVAPQPEKQALIDFLGQFPDKDQIWLLEDWPDIYHRLDKNCSTKYTDFRLVYDKLDCFPTRSETPLRTRRETDREIFLHWTSHSPEIVIDPAGIFSYIQDRYPVIDGGYIALENAPAPTFEQVHPISLKIHP